MLNYRTALAIIFFCTCCYYPAQARIDATGYIITLKNDTVTGRFDVNRYGLASGAFYKPYNFEAITWKIHFIPEKGEERSYEPGELKGFTIIVNNDTAYYESIKNHGDAEVFSGSRAPDAYFAKRLFPEKNVGVFIVYYNYREKMRYRGRGSVQGGANENHFQWELFRKKNKYFIVPSATLDDPDKMVAFYRDEVGLEEDFVRSVPRKRLWNVVSVSKKYNKWRNGDTDSAD